MLGRELRIPSELLYAGQCNNDKAIVSYGDFVANLNVRIQHAHDIARKRLGSNARRQSEIYEAKHVVNQYRTWDVVWVEKTLVRPGLSQKLQPRYRGSCLVVQKYNDIVFRVQLSKWGVCQVLFHNKMKLYKGDNIPCWITRRDI